MITNINSYLPPELIGKIITYSENPEASYVCKEWEEISNSNYFFNILLKKGKLKEISNIEVSNRKEIFKDKLVSKITPFLSEEKIKKLESINKLSGYYFATLLYFEKNKNLLILLNELISKIKKLDLKAEKKVFEDFNEAEFSKLGTARQAELLRSKVFSKETFEFLQKIEILDLSKKNMSSIPKEINFLTNLKQLILNFNSIESIPKSFGRFFYAIETIKLDNNHIKNLPANFGISWHTLKNISLNRNNLKELPNHFGSKWQELCTLYLSNNELVFLPKNFGKKWCKIQIINLQYNKLTEFRPHPHWKNLKVLDLSRNASNLNSPLA